MNTIVECPRCRRHYTLADSSPGVYCICHLYCSMGDSPIDCTVTEYNYSGTLKWPVGADTGSDDEGDDILHRAYYCSKHNKYIYKIPIFLEKDLHEKVPKWLKTIQRS